LGLDSRLRGNDKLLLGAKATFDFEG